MSDKPDLRSKVSKEFPDFAEEVVLLTLEDINTRLVVLTKSLHALDDAKEADEEYQAAKALVSEMSAPYRDAAKVVRMKSKYLILMLKDRGIE